VPFITSDASEMLAKHLAEQPPPLTLTGTPLASGLEAIVAKMLRKNPENRYATMEALVGDLGHLERGESLAARLPLAHDDAYVPRGQFATQAVTFLYKKLGKEPPR
jgi:serine/threonine-protein kinase